MIAALFAEQLEKSDSVTLETIEQMRALRVESGISDETLFESVIPGRTKLLYFMLDEPSRPAGSRVTILKCWDHELDAMEERFDISPIPNIGALPRLVRKQ